MGFEQQVVHFAVLAQRIEVEFPKRGQPIGIKLLEPRLPRGRNFDWIRAGEAATVRDISLDQAAQFTLGIVQVFEVRAVGAVAYCPILAYPRSPRRWGKNESGEHSDHGHQTRRPTEFLVEHCRFSLDGFCNSSESPRRGDRFQAVRLIPPEDGRRSKDTS